MQKRGLGFSLQLETLNLLEFRALGFRVSGLG